MLAGRVKLRVWHCGLLQLTGSRHVETALSECTGNSNALLAPLSSKPLYKRHCGPFPRSMLVQSLQARTLDQHHRPH